MAKEDIFAAYPEFSTDLNQSGLDARFNPTTSIVSDIVGGVAASVVDFGASVWNSLPFTPEVDTADLLSKVSDNALRVYNENPETIETASLIGGMFVPAGLAMKGMKMMRDGSKAVNWFTTAGRAEDTAKVAKAFAAGGRESGAYKTAMRELYMKSAANNLVDTVAAEFAILSVLNAHPQMEDYMADPVQNFALSLAGGAVLGGGIGYIADRYMAKQLTGGILEDAINKSRDAIKTVEPSMTNAVALQTHYVNIQNLDNILKEGAAAGKTIDDDVTLNVAHMMKTQAENARFEIFDTMVSPEIRNLPIAEKTILMDKLGMAFDMHGVNEVRFITDKEAIAKGFIRADMSVNTTAKPELIKSTLRPDGTVVKTEKPVIYYPELGAYAPMGSQLHYGNASVIVSSVEEAAKRFSSVNYKSPDFDTGITNMATSAPEVQARVIGMLARIQDLSTKEFGEIVASNSDTTTLTAILNKMRVDPALANAKVKVSDKSLFYQAQLDQVIVQQGPLTQKYTDAVDQVFNMSTIKQKDAFNPALDSSVSTSTKDMLSTWIGGDQWPLQEGSIVYFARGFTKPGSVAALKSARESVKNGTASYNDTRLVQGYDAFKELYESNASKKAREKFRAVSDNGYVYLYRGTHTRELKGAAPLESMTTDFAKASEFAHAHGQGTGMVSLYKIDVDDIVAVFEDFGKSKNQLEIMVRSSARESKKAIDHSGKVLTQTAPSSRVVKRNDNVKDADMKEIERLIRVSKAEQIDALVANGIPPESIAIKTNTPLAVVEAYMSDASAGVQVLERVISNFDDIAKRNGSSLNFDLATGNTISNLNQAAAALQIQKKPLVLTGDLKKNPYIEGHAALDNKSMKTINDNFIGAVLAGANSAIVKEWGGFMAENQKMFQMLNQQIGKVNQELAGARFVNSADFWARNMGDVGPVVSAIGKFTQKMSNDMIGRVATPIREAMTTVSTDEAAVIEFSLMKSINDGLKGWRKFDSDTGRIMQRVEESYVDAATGKTKTQMVLKAVQYNGTDYVVSTPAVKKLILEMQRQSGELRDLHNTVRKMQGVKDINDIGLWIPTFNPTNKFIAYLHDAKDGSTKIIAANTRQAYNDAVVAARKEIAQSGSKTVSVVERGQDQLLWSRLNGRLDSIHMERADVSKLKTGSAGAADVKVSLDIFGEIIGGYEHYITTQARNLVGTTMSDTMFMLDNMSEMNKWGFKGQPLTKTGKATQGPKDPASTLKNVLIGGTSLDEYGTWKDINNSFETILSFGINGIGKAWETATRPLTTGFFGGKKELTAEALDKLDYQKLVIDMENKGITNPWGGLDTATAAEKYRVAKLEDAPDISKRIIYAGNALAATIALRVGELAQPLVNIMSLPILTHLAAAQRFPETFMGVQKGTAKVSAVQIMYEGARAANSQHFKHFDEKWRKLGYFDQMISEANETLHQVRALDKGLIPAVERGVNSAMVNLLSKPADWSETFVRRQTMFTGAVLAKRLYPDLSDTGVTIFARDFMDKAVGNFHAPQRPVFFQGTLGVALGLFQTYSLTLGQSIYRHLELKNYKELGKAALIQSTIFGTGSMPGFAAVSNMIGEHFSEDHVDLETGTFRALNDTAAEMVLYGLPSQLGVGTHTRGDATFRIPGLTGDSVVAYNFAKQFVQGVQHMADAVGNADKSVPQAFAEALSLQSLSRPLARNIEWLPQMLGGMGGYSITQKGNTVSTPEEVWTFAGVAARVIGTRPLEEIKLRNVLHMKSYYGSIDYDRRQELMSELKTRIRAGTLTETDVAEASLKYLSTGGTPTGWRSAYAKALSSENTDGKEDLVNVLRPDSPLNYMINSLDGY